MGYEIEIEESDVQGMHALCDIALKAGGLQYYGIVARWLSLMPQLPPAPEPEAKKEG